ncbi:hypothetical protein [Nocardioides jishulii]|uniref:Uncharacterized protein n=1 Tax=Nocardioides jishulii TaxID=2575440 RepID=A0A4V5TKM2_9ACTN|nr:hypothetical protein [Nocardioides jishulii]QCX28860.1 hypothetical protein FCL41_16020 [Nocardioides jishulii]TKI64243.1 hypothetical protein FC770_03545 [Nocardioides jishulii]
MVTRRLSMHDEAAFLMLEAESPWDGAVVSEWVLYMGNNPNRGPVGWTVCFDGDRNEGVWDVEVTFEAVPEAPPLPATTFTDVVEVSAHGLVELMEGNWESHPVTSAQEHGWSRVRLSREQPRHGTPKLLVQSWPADRRAATVLRVADEPTADSWDVQLPGAEAGLEGAARIGAYVDSRPGRQSLSGELGMATATMDIPGSLARVSLLFEAGTIWTLAPDGYGATTGGYTDTDGELWATCYVKDASHPDHIAGTKMSAILTRPRADHDPPRRSALWFRWGLPVPPFHDELGTPRGYEPLLPRDTRVDVWYDPKPGKTISVRLEHSDVPAEWVKHLSAWWTYQLAIARGSGLE